MLALMKALMAALALSLALTCATQAQVTPTTPTAFTKRGLGASNATSSTVSSNGTSSANAGVSVPKKETVVRTVTYISLSPARQWTSTDGRPLIAKMIAFEDVTTEQIKTGNAPAPPAQPATMPTLPGKPTVVKEGKIRLLVGQQPYEIELSKLSALDRDYADTIKHGVAGK